MGCSSVALGSNILLQEQTIKLIRLQTGRCYLVDRRPFIPGVLGARASLAYTESPRVAEIDFGVGEALLPRFFLTQF